MKNLGFKILKYNIIELIYIYKIIPAYFNEILLLIKSNNNMKNVILENYIWLILNYYG